MGWDLGDIRRVASGAASAVVRTGAQATSAVAPAAASLGKDVLSLGREGLGEVRDTSVNVGNAVIHIPEAIPTWKRLVTAFRTHERTLLPGVMPHYPQLGAKALEAAAARGQGRTQTQSFITGEAAGGSKHEPTTLVVTGSKDRLKAALRDAGWVENDDGTALNHARQFLSTITRFDRVTEGPMSTMYMDGKLPAMAFSKNSDYNMARDHMRIYALPADPATGQPRWAIAATRDTAASVTIPKVEREGLLPWQWKMETPRFGHETDHDLDGERDLIMHDLLATGQVKDWAAVKGVPTGAKVSPTADGRIHLNQYVTDGRVYEVNLG